MVGFPGETEGEFKELRDFIEEAEFERMGVFLYSREEGTGAYNLSGQVPEKIKKARLNEIMKLQQAVSKRINEKFLNRRLDVLVDQVENEKDGVYIGRTQFDAPEVDGQVFVKGKNLKAGDFVKVRITDTLEYDLVGESL